MTEPTFDDERFECDRCGEIDFWGLLFGEYRGTFPCSRYPNCRGCIVPWKPLPEFLGKIFSREEVTTAEKEP